MKRIVFGMLCVINIFTLYGFSENERYNRNLDALAKFLDRYKCSEETEEQLLKSDGNFYLKNGPDRLVNAIRLQRLMQDNQITGIDIPQKCWSRRLQCVVSSAIPHLTAQEFIESGRKLTLEEVQKLSVLIEKTALNDLNYPNLCLGVNGRLALIDLEDKSFLADAPCTGVRRGLRKLSDWPMEAEAQQWLCKRSEEVEKTEEAKDSYDRIWDSLVCNRKYDDSDINFNQVKDALGYTFFCPEKK